MAKRAKRKTGFTIWFLLIGFPVVIVLGLRELGAFAWISELLSPGGGASSVGFVSADVSSDEFSVFGETLGVERDIRLTIVGLDEEYRISHDYDDRKGEAIFTVSPQGETRDAAAALSDVAVRALVSRGLRCFDPDGNELERPLYRDWEFVSSGNGSSRTWKVVLRGLHPAGSVQLSLGKNATDKFEVSLPPVETLSKIWKGRISFDNRRGTVRLNGYEFAPVGREPKGVPDHANPDDAKNMPGFRVLYVTADCAWLEIVYTKPSEAVLSRTRWPGLSIDYAVHDDGSSFKVVRFEGGYQSEENNAIIFPDKDRLILKKGDILAPNAVHFGWKDREGRNSVDLLVVKPRR